MSQIYDRDRIWSELDQKFDLLIIGGGITGAGIMNTAARSGLKVLLVEAGDFSSGTSSRSSKLVHGGFRYLKNRQINVTRESVRERERLLREAPHLVTPLYFILPFIGFSGNTRRMFRMGVTIYDLLAPKWAHGHLGRDTIRNLCPVMTNQRLTDGYYYYDAEVDDARMVLRCIFEGVRAGGLALNYARASSLIKQKDGHVCGAVIRDENAGAGGRTREVRARVVINATGPWTDILRADVGGDKRIRKLRGSHLIFPHDRLPLGQAITLLHPRDKRAMFVFPWEGVTIIGTTDLDHTPADEAAHDEPVITRKEVEYIMEAVTYLFPEAEINTGDILSTFAGLRPIVSGGSGNPSKESRGHALWNENGLITITGGKLTTYRRMALETLEYCRLALGMKRRFDPTLPLFSRLPKQPEKVDKRIWNRLVGRLGESIYPALEEAGDGETLSVPGLTALWLELRWAARTEAVLHLDDLLLRRTRIGLTAPSGGAGFLPRIKKIVQEETGWDDQRWEEEQNRYLRIWNEHFSIPITQKLID